MANENRAAPSPNRRRNHRRIRVATRGLAAVAAVATAVFSVAAAQSTRASSQPVTASHSSSPSGSSQSDEEDFGWLVPSQSAPQQSFGAPVAGSGGS